MKNIDIITLGNGGFLRATAHSLPVEHFYKFVKFKRAVQKAYETISKAQADFLNEVGLTLEDLRSGTADGEKMERYGTLNAALIAEETPIEEEKPESWWQRLFHWHRRRTEELREEHDAKLAALIPKPDYTPTVNVESLDDSQVTLIVRAWTEIPNYWNVLYDVNEQIYKQFPQHGIRFPFPQMDVHMQN